MPPLFFPRTAAAPRLRQSHDARTHRHHPRRAHVPLRPLACLLRFSLRPAAAPAIVTSHAERRRAAAVSGRSIAAGSTSSCRTRYQTSCQWPSSSARHRAAGRLHPREPRSVGGVGRLGSPDSRRDGGSAIPAAQSPASRTGQSGDRSGSGAVRGRAVGSIERRAAKDQTMLFQQLTLEMVARVSRS